MNYHPDELAFILIDYKGGGMAGVFENLRKVVTYLLTASGLVVILILKKLSTIETIAEVNAIVFSRVSKAVSICDDAGGKCCLYRSCRY